MEDYNDGDCTVGIHRSRWWYWRFWLANLINPDNYFNKINTLPDNEIARRIIILYHLHGDRLDDGFLKEELSTIENKLGIKQLKKVVL